MEQQPPAVTTLPVVSRPLFARYPRSRPVKVRLCLGWLPAANDGDALALGQRKLGLYFTRTLGEGAAASSN